MLRELPPNVGLIPPPLRRLLVEEHRVDLAVELVDVHAVDAILQPLVLAMKLLDRFAVELLHVCVALPQSSGQAGQKLIVKP